VKLAADTAIDVLATGICAAVVDVFTTGVGPGNVAASVSLYRQNQTANHCSYKTEHSIPETARGSVPGPSRIRSNVLRTVVTVAVIMAMIMAVMVVVVVMIVVMVMIVAMMVVIMIVMMVMIPIIVVVMVMVTPPPVTGRIIRMDSTMAGLLRAIPARPRQLVPTQT
jgi:hypothetical protein